MSAPQPRLPNFWNGNFREVTVKCRTCTLEYKTVNPRDSKYCRDCKRKLAAANSAKQYRKLKEKRALEGGSK